MRSSKNTVYIVTIHGTCINNSTQFRITFINYISLHVHISFVSNFLWNLFNRFPTRNENATIYPGLKRVFKPDKFYIIKENAT